MSPLFAEHRTFGGFLSLCYNIVSGEKVAEIDDNIYLVFTKSIYEEEVSFTRTCEGLTHTARITIRY